MSKLSEELTQLSNDIKKLSAADRTIIYAGIQAALGPVKSSRTTSAGEKVDTRDVDFAAIADALPPDLRLDWRQIQRDMNDAAKRHGNQWADESFGYIVQKYLLPQPTAGEQLLRATPGLAEAIAAQLPKAAPPAPVAFTLTDDVIAQLEKAGFTRAHPTA